MLPSHQAWNPKAASSRGRPPGIRDRAACERNGDAAWIGGSLADAARQAEIDQPLQGLERGPMFDNKRLSNTVGKAGVREGIGWACLPVNPNFSARPYAMRS